MSDRVARRPLLVLVGAVWLAVAACGQQAPPVPPVIAGPTDVMIVAENIEFHPSEAMVRAGVPLRITLDNRDEGVPHNVQLLAGPGFTTVLGETEIQPGPATGPPLIVPALVPGRYQLACAVHPNMTTDLTVELSQ